MSPCNDGFVGLDSARLPNHGTQVFYLKGYDAGTEPIMIDFGATAG